MCGHDRLIRSPTISVHIYQSRAACKISLRIGRTGDPASSKKCALKFSCKLSLLACKYLRNYSINYSEFKWNRNFRSRLRDAKNFTADISKSRNLGVSLKWEISDHTQANKRRLRASATAKRIFSTTLEHFDSLQLSKEFPVQHRKDIQRPWVFFRFPKNFSGSV